jgi:amidase
MDADDLAFAGLARHAELVRAGEVASRELVELFLARIARLDGELNAYRVVLAEEALAAAEHADARRAAGEERPLLGVPVAIKDDCDVAGQVTRFGGDAEDRVARADAEVVRRLRDAGAIVLGKTHVPELTITPFTESATFGVTRNPWDLQRTPGGSSGGSATAVAAGLASAALASDGAGSIRIPAGCCNLFGMKPERGRVPTAPRAEPWRGLSIWGPITRTVADWAAFADAIADGAPGYRVAAAFPPGRRRIAVATALPPTVRAAPDAEQLGALAGTADLLRDLGHDVVERELAWDAGMGNRVIVRYLRGIADQAGEVPHPQRLSRQARGFARLGRALPERQVRAAVARAPDDARRLGAIFADEGFDAVLTPMFTRRPPRLREYEGRSAAFTLAGTLRFVPYCGAFNHTGQPAAAVPAGFAGDGFPLSVQLAGPLGGERTLLSLAAQLEAARDWAAHRPAVAA